MAAPMRLVLASANPHKVTEVAAILGDRFRLEPRPGWVPDVVEDADTLIGNARLKASAIARAVDGPAVADDTGLEVDALGGRPGVRSARYAGEAAVAEDNITKLLDELRSMGATAPEDRRARFRTVAMVVWPDGREVHAEGVVEGVISMERAGSSGFGYDPVFVPDGSDGRTFAQMTGAEKDAISHRGRAFRELARLLSGGRADAPDPPVRPSRRGPRPR